MTKLEFYAMTALLVLILFLVAATALAVERAREELEEFRQYMMGEKTPRGKDF